MHERGSLEVLYRQTEAWAMQKSIVGAGGAGWAGAPGDRPDSDGRAGQERQGEAARRMVAGSRQWSWRPVFPKRPERGKKQLYKERTEEKGVS